MPGRLGALLLPAVGQRRAPGPTSLALGATANSSPHGYWGKVRSQRAMDAQCLCGAKRCRVGRLVPTRSVSPCEPSAETGGATESGSGAA